MSAPRVSIETLRRQKKKRERKKNALENQFQLVGVTNRTKRLIDLTEEFCLSAKKFRTQNREAGVPQKVDSICERFWSGCKVDHDSHCKTAQ